jgi:hypothetical protein
MLSAVPAEKVLTKKAALLGGGVAVVLVAALVTWLVWPSTPAEPRARQYRDATACLLTDARGVTGPGAAPVWAGLQAASLRTHGQVRYLAVTGDQTPANAQTFAGTLLLGRCSVIVAAPGIADTAVRAIAGQYASQPFVVVGGAEPPARNVTRVAAGQLSTVVGDRLAGN